MLLLGLDTATRRGGVVLANEHGMLGRVELGGTADTAPPRHAETLAPAIAWGCERCGVELPQISAVAVGIGPGMFTGLRVGVTTAKVLAQSLRVPVIPIPSLDLLAYPLRYARRLVVATIDARRHELYWALYRQVPGGVQRVSEYELGTPDDLEHAAVVVIIRHAVHADAHVDTLTREHERDRLAPLDDSDPALEQLFEAQIVHLLDPVEAIHVDVRDGDAAFVLLHDRERRARHRLRDTQRARQPFRERRLAGAEVAGEHDEVTGAELRSDRLTDRRRLVRSLRRQRCHRHLSARASARFTCTKSARASARARPPERRTAEGCSVGISTAA